MRKCSAIDKWILLHVRKTLLNLAVRFLNALIRDRAPEWPQTILLEQVYRRMFQAYRIEAYCGRFDDVPYQSLRALEDRHFLNVLELSRKLLIYLGDTDRYYRQWLGLFFLLISDSVEEQRKNLGYQEFLDSAWNQWEFDMRGGFPSEFFEVHRELFQQIQLANHLFTLCGKRYENIVPPDTQK